jgi:hypothetical protein
MAVALRAAIEPQTLDLEPVFIDFFLAKWPIF